MFLGITYATMDVIITGWGIAYHRLISSWLIGGKVLILFLLKAQSATTLFIIDGLFLLITDIILIIIYIHIGTSKKYNIPSQHDI
ncbi:hypothetical protein kam1_1654 [Methylacidiphilum kamchatkense Kam1]|uniref:Uncharacterized protein n=2 Tax=Methylacidiphilum kamchatkense TaxID=431057 RepID=A0A516TNQ9_9BACT|nr:hypothetical protein kam1_1654 [Methylacidiphilum kamchatkense Kam1]